MKTPTRVLTAALLVLLVSSCAAPASTQTGGGTSTGGEHKTSAPEPAAEVKPGTIADAVAAGWLAGTAQPTLPNGSEGKVDVVASGPIVPSPSGISVPIVLRNMTADAITSIDVAAAATDASGTILGSGQSQGMNPTSVPSGGVALGYVYFAPNTEIPADAKLEFTVASQPVKGLPYFRDLKIEQANLAGQNIAGKAANSSQDTLNGPYGVHVTCFDESGNLLSTLIDFASPAADIAAGQSVTFQVPLFDRPCPSFLLGVSGYGPLS